MQKRKLGRTGLTIAPLVFGGNVFGWTIDKAQSFRVLDAFVDHGFDAIDTADVYSRWVPGNQGGESETIIGEWLAARPGMRDRVKIFTKVGWDMGLGKGLSPGWIDTALEASLARLQTDYIDLYFSHLPDPEVPHQETLASYDRLLKAGTIRSIGASNYDAALLKDSFGAAADAGLPAYQAIQPEYNLMDRGSFEGPLRDLCLETDTGVVTYFSLASGFLSGKYRSKADAEGAARGSRVEKYLTPRGFAVIDALEGTAPRHGAKPAEVALAWVMAQRGVTAPIASATRVEQVESFARAAELKLTEEDLVRLDIPA